MFTNTAISSDFLETSAILHEGAKNYNFLNRKSFRKNVRVSCRFSNLMGVFKKNYLSDKTFNEKELH